MKGDREVSFFMPIRFDRYYISFETREASDR